MAQGTRSRTPLLSRHRLAWSFVAGLAITAAICVLAPHDPTTGYHASSNFEPGTLNCAYRFHGFWYERISVTSSLPLFMLETEEMRKVVIAITSDLPGPGKQPPRSPDVLPYWLTFPPPAEAPSTQWHEAAVGWPWRAIRLRSFRENGLRFDSPPGVTRIAPYWPGLLGDVIAWSAAAWLIIGLPSFARGVRADRRRKHGLCGRCAYPRVTASNDAPCPECGETDL